VDSQAAERIVSRGLCLTTLVVLAACTSDAPDADTLSAGRDTIAPVGQGTETLLTRERLAVIDQWIRAARERTGDAPAAIDGIAPPDSVASLYVPLDRYLRDGWGRHIEYSYDARTRTYDLRSSGADGVLHSPDDITLQSQ
jgi:hypothetical protein